MYSHSLWPVRVNVTTISGDTMYIHIRPNSRGVRGGREATMTRGEDRAHGFILRSTGTFGRGGTVVVVVVVMVWGWWGQRHGNKDWTNK